MTHCTRCDRPGHDLDDCPNTPRVSARVPDAARTQTPIGTLRPLGRSHTPAPMANAQIEDAEAHRHLRRFMSLKVEDRRLIDAFTVRLLNGLGE